jgi:hypothetical protein
MWKPLLASQAFTRRNGTMWFATAVLMRVLDSAKAFFSTACIFLPERDKNFGVHHRNDVDNVENDNSCYCHKLYGKVEDWGCEGFHMWRNAWRGVGI